MFFKRLFYLIFLSVLMWVQSCGLGIHEEAPRAVPMVIPEASLGCSVNIFEREDAYFQGEATNEDIQKFWDCTQSALTLFMKHTRGAESGKYSASELKSFLETYFLDSRKIPQNLFNEAMNLRVGIMGGTRDEVQRKDLETLIRFTDLIRIEMLRLRAYMPITEAKVVSFNEEELKIFIEDVQLSIKNTGAFFLNFSGSYKFSLLDTLILELGNYLESAHKGTSIAASLFKLIDSYQNNQKLIKLAKRTFITQSSPDDITPKDFHLSFKKISLAFETIANVKYWEYNYKLDYQNGGLDFFEKVLLSSNTLIYSLLKDLPEETLPFEVMDEWVDLFNENKWIPFNLTSISVKNILRPVVRKLLAGQDTSLTGRNAVGLTLVSYLRAMTQISEWLIGQKHLRSLFSGKKVKKRSELLELAEQFNKKNPLREDKIKSFIYDDIHWVLKTQRPLFIDDEPYLSFPNGHMKSHHDLSLRFLSQIHWLRALGRFAISGYTDNLEPKTPAEISQMGLNMLEFQTLYKDLTEIGIQMKFIYMGNTEAHYEEFTDSGSKRFREANLFMSLSDGGENVHMDEAVEYFSFLFSIKSLSDLYFVNFSDVCGTHLDEDIFGSIDHFIKAPCFRSEFYKRLTDPDRYDALNFKKSMPRLAKYYSELSEKDKGVFAASLEKASRLHLKPEDSYQKADLESYLMILQYVETAFIKYDHDSNEILDEAELDEAYAVFYVALKEIIDQKMPGLLQEIEKDSFGMIKEDMVLYLIYTYLLYYKKPPSFNKALGTAQLISWWRKRYLPVWPQKSPKIEASRITFLSVMSTLGEATIPKDDKGGELPESVTLAK